MRGGQRGMDVGDWLEIKKMKRARQNPGIRLPGTVTHRNIIGEMMHTGYHNYLHKSGIHGLYRERGATLDLLVVHAQRPGTGQFRAFIAACQAVYPVICVWQIWNPGLPAMLTRYGFVPARHVERDGEHVSGMCWTRAETKTKVKNENQVPQVLPWRE